MGITGTAATSITVCLMSSLLLILSTFFDDNGSAGPTHKSLSSCDLCPPQGLLVTVSGSGGRRLRGRLPPGKVAFIRSCRLPSARHPNGFSPFLFLSKVFYTRLELLLGFAFPFSRGIPPAQPTEWRCRVSYGTNSRDDRRIEKLT